MFLKSVPPDDLRLFFRLLRSWDQVHLSGAWLLHNCTGSPPVQFDDNLKETDEVFSATKELRMSWRLKFNGRGNEAHSWLAKSWEWTTVVAMFGVRTVRWVGCEWLLFEHWMWFLKIPGVLSVRPVRCHGKRCRDFIISLSAWLICKSFKMMQL